MPLQSIIINLTKAQADYQFFLPLHFYFSFTLSSSSSSLYSNIDINDLFYGLLQKIYYSGDLLGFMLIVNHVL